MTRAEWRSTWVQAADLVEGDWFIHSGWAPRRVARVEHDTTGEWWGVQVWWETTSPPPMPDLDWARWRADQLVEVLVPS
jgi:hypothetical protein